MGEEILSARGRVPLRDTSKRYARRYSDGAQPLAPYEAEAEGRRKGWWCDTRDGFLALRSEAKSEGKTPALSLVLHLSGHS